MINAKPSDFTVGQVYKFEKGKYGSCQAPFYYAEIVSVSSESITTSIPGYTTSIIRQRRDNMEWNSHTERMSYVGMKEDVGDLLLNQNLIHKYYDEEEKKDVFYRRIPNGVNNFTLVKQ